MIKRSLITVFAVFLSVVFLLASPAAAGSAPQCVELPDEELAEITGMGVGDLQVTPLDLGLSFTYSEISGNAFQGASGIIIVTPVPGDGNKISYIIDLDVNVYFIEMNNCSFEVSIITCPDLILVL